MRVLVIGPSDTKSRGGMATVISGIRNNEELNSEFDIDIHSSYIDGNIVVRLIYSIYAYLKFLTFYKKYDLFHIHSASFGSTFRKRWYLKTIKKAGKKAIVHIHGAKYLVFYDNLNPKRKKKVLQFLNDADMVLALSEDWKEKFEDVFKIKNCHVLNNGIDTDEFKSAICECKQYKNSFVLLGRLGERKGVYDLINAALLAVKANPDIKIYLAGDGEIEKVKKVVEEKKLKNNIEVIGWVDFSGKIELLKKSATLVLPSYNEGLPMSVLEGMAAGKAIISTTVGAIPELVKPENGILISPGDVQALAEAIVKCSLDDEMISKMSQKNIEKINAEFSMKKMHKILAEYYVKVMKNGG